MSRLNISDLVTDTDNKALVGQSSISHNSPMTLRKQNSRKFDLTKDLDARLFGKATYGIRTISMNKTKLPDVGKDDKLSVITNSYGVTSFNNIHSDSSLFSPLTESSITADNPDEYTLHLEKELHKKTLDVFNLRHIVASQNTLLDSQQSSKRPEAELLREAALVLDDTEQDRRSLQVKLQELNVQSAKDIKVLQDKLEKTSSESDLKIAFITQQHQKLLVDFDRQTKRVNDKKAVINKLEQKLSAVVKLADRKLTEVRAEHVIENDRLLSELAQSKERLSWFQSELSNNTTDGSATMVAEIAELKQQLHATQNSSQCTIYELESTINTLRQELVQKETAVSEHELTLLSVQTDNAVISVRLDMLNEMIVDLTNQLMSSQINAYELTQSQVGLEQQLTATQAICDEQLIELSMLRSDSETEKHQLVADLDASTAEATRLRALVGDAEHQLVMVRLSSEEHITQQKAVCSDLQTKLETLSSQLTVSHLTIRRLEEQLKNSNDEAECTISELRVEHDQKVATLSETLSAVQSSEKDLQRVVAELRDQLSTQIASSQNAVSSDKLKTLESKNQSLSQELACTKDSLKLKQMQLITMKSDLESSQAVVTGLQSQLSKSDNIRNTEDARVLEEQNKNVILGLQTTVADLQQQLESSRANSNIAHDSALSEIRAKLNISESVTDELQFSLSSLTFTHEECTAQLTDLQCEYESSLSQPVEAQELIAQLEQQLEEVTQRHVTDKEESENKHLDVIEELRNELLSVQSELDECNEKFKSQIIKCEASKSELQISCDRASSELKVSHLTIRNLEEQLNVRTVETERVVGDLRSEYDQKVAELNEVLFVVQSSEKELQHVVAELRDQLSTQTTSSQNTVSSDKLKALDSKNQSLSQELARTKDSLKLKQMQLITLKSDLVSSQAVVTDLQTQLSKSDNNRNTDDARVLELQKAVIDLQQQLDSVQCSAVLNASIAHGAAMSEVRAKLDLAETTTHELQMSLSSLTSTHEECTSQLTDLQCEYESSLSQLVEAQELIAQLEQQLEELTQRHVLNKEESESRHLDAIEELRSELLSVQSQHDESIAVIESLKSNAVNYEIQLTELKNQLTQCEAPQLELQNYCEQLEGELSLVQGVFRELSASAELLGQQLNDSRAAHTNLENEICALQNERDQVRERLLLSEQEISARKLEHNALVTETTDKLNAQIECVSDENNTLMVTISRLQSELSDMAVQLVEANAEIARLSTRLGTPNCIGHRELKVYLDKQKQSSTVEQMIMSDFGSMNNDACDVVHNMLLFDGVDPHTISCESSISNISSALRQSAHQPLTASKTSASSLYEILCTSNLSNHESSECVISDLRQQVRRTETEIHSLKELLSSLQTSAELESLRQSDELNVAYKTLDTQREDLKMEVSHSAEVAKIYEQQLAYLKCKLSAADEIISTLEKKSLSQMSERELAFTSFRIELESSNAVIISGLEDTISRLEIELKSLQLTNATDFEKLAHGHNAAIAEKDIEIARLLEQIVSIECALAESQSQLLIAKSANEETVSTLQSQFFSTQTIIQELQSTYCALQQQLSDSISSFSAQQQEMKEMHKAIQADLTESLSIAQSTIEDLEVKLVNSAKSHEIKLVEMHDSHATAILGVERQLLTVTEKANQLQSTEALLRNAVDEKAAALLAVELECRRLQAIVSNLESKECDLKTTIDELDSTCERIQNEKLLIVSEHQDECSKLNETLATIQLELSSTVLCKNELETFTNELRANISILEEKLKAQEQHSLELQDKHATAESERISAITELKSNIVELESRLMQCTSEHDAYIRELRAEHEVSLNSSQNEVVAMKATNAELQAKIASLEQQLLVLQSSIEDKLSQMCIESEMRKLEWEERVRESMISLTEAETCLADAQQSFKLQQSVYEEQLQSTKTSLRELEESIAVTNKESAMTLAESESKCISLCEQLTVAEAKCTSLTVENSDLRLALELSNAMLAEQQQKLLTLTDSHSVMIEELKCAHTSAISEMSSRSEDLQNALDQVQAQLADNQSEYTSKVGDLQHEHTNELSVVTDKLTSSEANVLMLQETVSTLEDQLTASVDDVKRLTNLCSQTMTQLQTVTATSQGHKTASLDTQSELSQCKIQLSVSQSKMNELCDEHSREREMFQHQIDYLQSVLSDKESGVVSSLAELSNLRDKLTSIESELSTSHDKYAELQFSLTSLQSVASCQEQRLVDIELSRVDLEDQMTVVRSNHESALSELRAEHSTSLQIIETELHTIHDTVSQMTLENSSLEAQLVGLNSECANQSIVIERLNADKSELETQLGEMRSLSDSNETLLAESTALNEQQLSQITVLETKLISQKSAAESMVSKLSLLEREKVDTEAKLSNLKCELCEAEKSVRSYQVQMAAAEQVIKEYAIQIETLQTQLSEVADQHATEREALEVKLIDAESSIAELGVELQKSQQEVVDTKTGSEETLRDLRSNLTALESQLETSKTAAEKAQSMNAGLKGDILKYQIDMEEMKTEHSTALQIAQLDVQTTRDVVVELKETVSNLTHIIGEHVTCNRNLEDQVAVLNSECTNHSVVVERIIADKSELEAQLSELRDLSDNNAALLAESTTLNEQQLSQITVLETELISQKSAVESLVSKLSLLEREKVDTEAKLSNLKCELCEAEKTVKMLQMKLVVAEETMSEHTVKIESLQTQIADAADHHMTEREALELKLVDAEGSIAELGVELKKSQQELVDAMADSEDTLRDLRSNLSALESQLEASKTATEKAQSMNAGLKGDILKYQIDIEEMKTEHSTALQIAQLDVQATRDVVVELKETVSNLTYIIGEHVTCNSKLEDQVAVLNSECTNHSVVVERLSANKSELETQLSELRDLSDSNAALLAESTALSEKQLSHIAVLETELISQKSAAESLVSKLSLLEREKVDTEAKLSNVDHELGEAEKTVKMLQMKLVVAEETTNAYTVQIESLQKQIADAADHHKIEREALELKLIDAESSITELVVELKKSQQVVVDAKTASEESLVNMRMSLSAVECELETSKSALDTVTAQLADITTEQSALLTELDNTRDSVSQLTHELESSKEREKLSQSQFTDALREVAELHSVIGELEGQLATVSRSREDLDVELNSTKSELVEAKQLIVELHTHVQERDIALSNVQSSTSGSEQELSTLRTQKAQQSLALSQLKSAHAAVVDECEFIRNILVYLVGPDYSEIKMTHQYDVPYVTLMVKQIRQLQLDLDCALAKHDLLLTEVKNRHDEELALRETISNDLSEKTNDAEYLLAELIGVKVICANLSYELSLLKKRTTTSHNHSVGGGRIKTVNSVSSLNSFYDSIPEVTGEDGDDDEDEDGTVGPPLSDNNSVKSNSSGLSKLKSRFSIFNMDKFKEVDGKQNNNTANESGTNRTLKMKSFAKSALKLTDVLNLGLFEDEIPTSSNSSKKSGSAQNSANNGGKHSVNRNGKL